MMVRGIALALLWAIALIFCWGPLRVALNLGFHDDRYVSVIAAPVICAALFYRDRKRIFSRPEWGFRTGLPLWALFLIASVVLTTSSKYANDGAHLSLAIMSCLIACAGAFLVCWGPNSFRAALFPLCCLLLAVPVPAWAMDWVTTALQHGSAVVSCEMMRLSGVPVFAEGQRLALPGVEIEVAPECSGIRSCLALALVTLLAGALGLRRGWSRAALILSSIPLAIVKNALRISVLAVLASYVNPAILQSPVHHYGGAIFTPLEVAALAALLFGLRKLEALRKPRKAIAGSAIGNLQPST